MGLTSSRRQRCLGSSDLCAVEDYYYLPLRSFIVSTASLLQVNTYCGNVDKANIHKEMVRHHDIASYNYCSLMQLLEKYAHKNSKIERKTTEELTKQ